MNQVNRDGDPIGYLERYHINGQLWFKGHYDKDNLVGYWESYYSNGHSEYKGHYENGKSVGYWEWYHPNGELWDKELYI